MEGPIRVDLEEAQECKAIDMIRFLFAFCNPRSSEKVPACNSRLLDLAFEKVKKIAKDRNNTLETELNNL